MKILITGMAGTGKTTLVSKLKEQSFTALDLDDCDVCMWVDKETGVEASYTEGKGEKWISQHRWVVSIPKLKDLLGQYDEQDVFVSGKISRTQIIEVSTLFDKVILLKPHDTHLHERLRTRTSNKYNFGKLKEERDRVVNGRQRFEDECVKAGAVVLENNGTIAETLDEVLEIAGR
ncbi:MAG: AAA family ATPase [Candidatus Paceibacterota bacterium]